MEAQLFNMAKTNGFRTIKPILKSGINTNIIDKHGYTPLYYAVTQGHARIVKSLCKYGADPNVKFSLEHGRSLIHFVVSESIFKYGMLNIIHYLLQYGADPNAGNIHGNTPLHIVGSSTRFAKILIKAGANPNVQNDAKETPLHRMVVDNYINTARTLMKAGADMHILDHHNETPVDIAIRTKNDDFIKLFDQYNDIPTKGCYE